MHIREVRESTINLDNKSFSKETDTLYSVFIWQRCSTWTPSSQNYSPCENNAHFAQVLHGYAKPNPMCITTIIIIDRAVVLFFIHFYWVLNKKTKTTAVRIYIIYSIYTGT